VRWHIVPAIRFTPGAVARALGARSGALLVGALSWRL
jgi:hypothetical protein